MFETLEVGKQIKSSDFNELQKKLRAQLLMAQLDLATRDYLVIIVVAGNDKPYARIQILKTFCQSISQALRP